MKTSMITNKNIFTTNWAQGDRRSVKASLVEHSNSRVLWWEINRRLHKLLRHDATLEEIMFSFHSRHHALTLFSLKYWADVQKVTATIRSHGFLAGIRTAIASSNENTPI
ncbi:hypothetical protein [Massilia timonae]|uniref:hypothetical protein n=1 Tax=Massilia timonae TaxID=47229 RepID=UPI0028A2848D|nr:hypothetical protein [Massilia timonae]